MCRSNRTEVEVEIHLFNMATQEMDLLYFDTTISPHLPEHEYQELMKVAWEVTEEELGGEVMDDLELGIRIIKY